MSMGAVLYRAGTVKASELGGLYKSMPWTMVFCFIGAASISAFPLFSGFVTKSLTLTGVVNGDWNITWFVLLFASAGVLHHSGIKIPFYGFFGHGDTGFRCKEAPFNMLLAMGIIAFLCIAIGVYPQPLYDILPYDSTAFQEFEPYTSSHVVTQLQLLVFAVFSFAILARKHLETPELPSINVDFDWTYRKLLPAVWRGLARVWLPLSEGFFTTSKAFIRSAMASIQDHCGGNGAFARTWMTGGSVMLVVLILAGYLLSNFLQ
jgi:multicomponent Na+:H+ antiporter subunit D